MYQAGIYPVVGVILVLAVLHFLGRLEETHVRNQLKQDKEDAELQWKINQKRANAKAYLAARPAKALQGA
jgi:hypothetical protein